MILLAPLLTAIAAMTAGSSDASANSKIAPLAEAYHTQILSPLIEAFKEICLKGYPSREKTIFLLKGWKPFTNGKVRSLQKNGVSEFFGKGDITVVLSRYTPEDADLFACHVSAGGPPESIEASVTDLAVRDLSLGKPTNVSPNFVDWQRPDVKQVMYWEVIRKKSDALAMLRIQPYSGKAN